MARARSARARTDGAVRDLPRGLHQLGVVRCVTRAIGHPWLWLQEVTSTFFIYGIFIGAAAATRRNDHLYLTAMTEAMTGALRLIVESLQPAGRARGRAVHGLFRLHQFPARVSAASACRR